MRLIDALSGRGDVDALFAPSARFRSPFADYGGRDDVVHLVGQIRTVLDDVRIVRRLEDGASTMSTFEGRVGDEAVQGVLVEERDGDGRLSDAMLTVRPYAGLRAAMREMALRLEAAPLPSRRAS